LFLFCDGRLDPYLGRRLRLLLVENVVYEDIKKESFSLLVI
jgi:hypothetical protein